MATSPRQHPWAALQHRNFALLAGGQLVSQIGSGMQTIVVAWQIYELTNSALSVGLTGLARAIPVIVFSLVGGVVADAVDRRKLLVVTQSLAMASAIVLGVLTGLGVIAPWMIYLITFVNGAATSFDSPARSALLPSLVPEERLNNAVSLLIVIRHTGSILGPAAGGIVVAATGVTTAYWINAASFLAIIGALLVMRIGTIAGRARRHITPAMLIEGWRFIWGAPVVLAVLSIDFMNTFFANTRSSLPTFARDVFQAGPEGLGMLGSATSVGAVVGIAAALALGDVRRKGLGIALCSLGYGASVVGFALAPALIAAAFALGCVGFVDAINDTMNGTLLLTATPDALRGRVNSVGIMLTNGGPSLGQLWVGFLVSALGPRIGVGVGGAVVVLFASLLLLFAR